MEDTMEDDTQSDDAEKTKTLRVEDWEQKGEAIREWLDQELGYKRWKIYGVALLLAGLPTYASLPVLVLVLYKAYERGFILSDRFVKEAEVEE